MAHAHARQHTPGAQVVHEAWYFSVTDVHVPGDHEQRVNGRNLTGSAGPINDGRADAGAPVLQVRVFVREEGYFGRGAELVEDSGRRAAPALRVRDVGSIAAAAGRD